MRRTPVSVATAAMLTLTMSGCAQEPGAADASITAKTNAPTTTETAAETTSTPTPTTVVLRMGQAFTWQDKVSVIVSGPDNATLSDTSSAGKAEAKLITVQVQNGSAEVLSLDAVTVRMSYGPAGLQAEHAFDSENEYEALTGSLPPGGTGTARYAFAGVTDPSVITVEVVPSWNHNPAFWRTP